MGSADFPRLTDVRPPGARSLSMVRLIRLLAINRGEFVSANAMAASMYPADKPLQEVLRSAVVAGNLGSIWGGDLVATQTLSNELIEAMRPSSIVLRLAGTRRVPFNVRTPRITASSTVGWVAPGAPKPVSEMTLDETSLGVAKAAGIVVISQELARSSSPSAEATIRQDLVGSINQFVDTQFIDPSNVAVAGSHPGSILSGVAAIASSGTSASAVAVDLNTAVAALVAAGSTMQAPLWVMHPVVATKIALLRDSQNGTAFPGIGYNGGTLAGIPCITSTAVPKTASGGSIIVLVDQSEVLLADDGQVAIDVSARGTLQLDSAPSAGAAAQISLWQNNLVGIRAERFINWQPRRAAGATAQYIDAVFY